MSGPSISGEMKKAALITPARTTLRERQNWLIHQLYIRGEQKECLKVIEEQLKCCNGLCEYPIFVKGILLLFCFMYFFI
jgi:hypothetical protein